MVGFFSASKGWGEEETPLIGKFNRPATYLVLVLIVHVWARAASFNHYHKVDSFTLGICSYKMWHAGAEFADLVPDKPPGQALLTGWVFHLLPDPPTRLALIPVESVFLLGAYFVFWRIVSLILAAPSAAVATMFLAVAHNTYNVLDFTTDGFNLGESYLALPILLAVYAHGVAIRPARRGFLQGLAVGTALTVKQSAVGLLAVLILHEIVMNRKRRAWKAGARAALATFAGVLCAFLPSILFLLAHGWLGDHATSLWKYTGVHGQMNPLGMPAWYNVEPLLPVLAWIVLGASASFACLAGTRTDRVEMVADGRARIAGVWSFVLLWVAAELAILGSMTKPSSHYFQQIVAPLSMLGALGFARFAKACSALEDVARNRTQRWLGATMAVITLVASRPIFSEASRRVPTFDYQRETDDFQTRLQTKPVLGVALPP